LLRLESRTKRQRAQRFTRRERAVDDADESDDAAVLVVRRIEDERAAGSVWISRRRRDARDDGVEDILDAMTGLGGDAQDLIRLDPEQLGELRRGAVRVGLRQVDLVHDRNDL